MGPCDGIANVMGRHVMALADTRRYLTIEESVPWRSLGAGGDECELDRWTTRDLSYVRIRSKLLVADGEA